MTIITDYPLIKHMLALARFASVASCPVYLLHITTPNTDKRLHTTLSSRTEQTKYPSNESVLIRWAVLSLPFSFLGFPRIASEQHIKNTNNLTPSRAGAQNRLMWSTDLQSAHWVLLFFFVRKDIDREEKRPNTPKTSSSSSFNKTIACFFFCFFQSLELSKQHTE